MLGEPAYCQIRRTLCHQLLQQHSRMETSLWWRSIAQQAEQRVPSRRRRRSAPDDGTSLCLTIPGDGDAGALRVCALAWQVPAFPCAHASVRQARPGQASSRWVRQVVCFGWSESWSDGLTTCPGRHAVGWAIDRPLAEERPSRLSPSNAGNKEWSSSDTFWD